MCDNASQPVTVGQTPRLASAPQCRSDPTFDFADSNPWWSPKKVSRCSDHCSLQESQRHQQTQSATHPARGSGPGLFGQTTYFLPLRPRVVVPSDNRAQRHVSTHGVFHPNGLLRVTGNASGQQHIAWLVCQRSFTRLPSAWDKGSLWGIIFGTSFCVGPGPTRACNPSCSFLRSSSFRDVFFCDITPP